MTGWRDDMNSNEIKLCIEASITERNHIKDDLRAYIRDYLKNITLDTEYNKGFHDAFIVFDCKIKEI